MNGLLINEVGKATLFSQIHGIVKLKKAVSTLFFSTSQVTVTDLLKKHPENMLPVFLVNMFQCMLTVIVRGFSQCINRSALLNLIQMLTQYIRPLGVSRGCTGDPSAGSLPLLLSLKGTYAVEKMTSRVGMLVAPGPTMSSITELFHVPNLHNIYMGFTQSHLCW